MEKRKSKFANRTSDREEHYRNIRQGLGLDNHDRSDKRPFALNQVVRHIGTGILLTVIGYGREQVQCRKPDLSSDYFYIHELEAINENDTNKK